ncbi:hypothetical protein QCA50_005684 [Cerrena zonata]|uniref:Uncharacterized protein n=1 Tax=Cerrena zonata TaxID=2478898 RepID=A0AAW0GLY2_9APHY
MKSILSVASVLLIVGNVAAICPGFNFGISNVQPLTGGFNRWDVYDNSCDIVDSLTTDENPCDLTVHNIFTCGPPPNTPPILFTGYTSSLTGTKYACRPDSGAGSCGSTGISVCCRNDSQ